MSEGEFGWAGKGAEGAAIGAEGAATGAEGAATGAEPAPFTEMSNKMPSSKRRASKRRCPPFMFVYYNSRISRTPHDNKIAPCTNVTLDKSRTKIPCLFTSLRPLSTLLIPEAKLSTSSVSPVVKPNGARHKARDFT